MVARITHGVFLIYVLLVSYGALALFLATLALLAALFSQLTGIELLIVTLPGGDNAFALLVAFLLSLVLGVLLAEHAVEAQKEYDKRYPIQFP